MLRACRIHLTELDQYTVFAPTDAAFAALGDAVLNALLGDVDRLRSILSTTSYPAEYRLVSSRAETSSAVEGDASIVPAEAI